MIRTLRGMVGCGFLAVLLVASFAVTGCDNIPSGACTADTDCTAPAKCDLTTGQCKTAAGPGCTDDASCGEGKVCDKNAGANGTCFDKCADDSTCSEGSTCDTTLQRCVCKQDTCDARDGGGKYACHPVTNICAVICSNNDQCDSGETCEGPADKKVCLVASDVKHACSDDAGCANSTDGPVCDTAAFPRKCMAKPGCAADADCTADPAKTKCDTTTKECLQCLADADCTGGGTCDIDGTCKAPTNCTDSKTCYDATAGNYCPDTSSACKAAEFDCTADSKASGNDSWKDNFKTGKGSAIWNVQAQRLTDAKSCSDFPPNAAGCTDGGDCGSGEICSTVIKKCVGSCDTNDDCDSGQVCNKDLGDIPAGKGACVVGITNGTVELKFNFFNPGGKFKTGKDDPKNSIVQLHDTGGIATEVTIEGNGTKTEGVAQFSFCDSSKSGSFSFFVKDEDGNPSNHGCYTISAP